MSFFEIISPLIFVILALKVFKFAKGLFKFLILVIGILWVLGVLGFRFA
ncbi:hypothetical protein [uncultured Clostridium sp.]|nr:hypothetical protein [uncultured Clostridium sp.]